MVALKSLHLAKSRIDAEVGFRRELAWSMLVDTVTALQAVIPVVVVVGDGLPPVGSAQLVPDPGRDLNAAFTAGAAHLLDHGITEVLASVADLPALRSASVDQFVGALPQQRRLFLRDAAGFGTTMLLARSCAGRATWIPGSRDVRPTITCARVRPIRRRRIGRMPAWTWTPWMICGGLPGWAWEHAPKPCCAMLIIIDRQRVGPLGPTRRRPHR